VTGRKHQQRVERARGKAGERALHALDDTKAPGVVVGTVDPLGLLHPQKNSPSTAEQLLDALERIDDHLREIISELKR